MRTKLALSCFVVMALAPLPVLAHHAFAAVFDAEQPLDLTGTVTKIEWTNPHIWVYLDVASAEGETVAWQCEGGTPNSLVRFGWSRDTVKEGDEVQIEGFRARDGSDTCNIRVITRDGRRLFAGSSFEEQ